MIGAGKSTLATELGKALGLPVFYEEVIDNEYLTDFYKDMKKYSFPLQIHLLNKRFRQHQQIIWKGAGGVQDRTIYEDRVFAKMLKDMGFMEQREYTTYVELFSNLSNFMRKPNLIIFLDVSPGVSLTRIKTRARPMESDITLDYLTPLHEAYKMFIKDISKVIPVIRVDWNEFRSPQEMAVMIKTEYEKLQIIHEVDWQETQKN